MLEYFNISFDYFFVKRPIYELAYLIERTCWPTQVIVSGFPRTLQIICLK